MRRLDAPRMTQSVLIGSRTEIKAGTNDRELHGVVSSVAVSLRPKTSRYDEQRIFLAGHAREKIVPSTP